MRKYLSFIIVIFILYSLIENMDFKVIDNKLSKQQAAGVEKTNSQPVFEGNWLERKIAQTITNVVKTSEGKAFIQNLVQPINKMPLEQYNLKIEKHEIINKLLNAEIVKAGYGSKRAVCGSTVIVEYSLYNNVAAAVGDTSNSLAAKKIEKTVQLGSSDIDLAIENSVINMQVDEIRNVLVSPYLLLQSKFAENTKIQLYLKEIITNPYDSNIKFFDDNLGLARPILCGEKIEFDIEIANISGKVIYSGSNLIDKVGREKLPPAITIGLYGKSLKSNRTVIISGRDIINADYSYKNFDPTIIKPDHMYLVTLKNTRVAVKL